MQNQAAPCVRCLLVSAVSWDPLLAPPIVPSLALTSVPLLSFQSVDRGGRRPLFGARERTESATAALRFVDRQIPTDFRLPPPHRSQNPGSAGSPENRPYLVRPS